MKVKELIELLKEFDGNLEIVQKGYEGGYYNPVTVESINLLLYVNDEWYYGPHEEESYFDGDKDNTPRTRATGVLII
jgi:hypothetical protein